MSRNDPDEITLSIDQHEEFLYLILLLRDDYRMMSEESKLGLGLNQSARRAFAAAAKNIDIALAAARRFPRDE